MENLLQRLVAAASRKRKAGEAVVRWHDARHLSNLRIVKRAHGGNATNKAGRIVLRGESAGRQVKVYEAFSEEHAAFIEAVCTIDRLRAGFPKVYGRSGRFIAVEWLSGQSIKTSGSSASTRRVMHELVELQFTLHSIPASSVPVCGFDYWRDLLRPRFMKAMELINERELAAQAVATVDDAWHTGKRVLIHPDITPANVVQDAQGTLSVIDNELLTTGAMPLIALCNTLRGFGSRYAADYASMYIDRMAAKLAPNDIAQLEAMWFARCVGSDFVAGEIGTVCQRVQMFRDRKSQLPFIVGRN